VLDAIVKNPGETFHSQNFDQLINIVRARNANCIAHHIEK